MPGAYRTTYSRALWLNAVNGFNARELDLEKRYGPGHNGTLPAHFCCKRRGPSARGQPRQLVVIHGNEKAAELGTPRRELVEL